MQPVVFINQATHAIRRDADAIKAVEALHAKFCPEQVVAMVCDQSDVEDGFLVTADDLAELRRLAALYPERVNGRDPDTRLSTSYPIHYHLAMPAISREELLG